MFYNCASFPVFHHINLKDLSLDNKIPLKIDINIQDANITQHLVTIIENTNHNTDKRQDSTFSIIEKNINSNETVADEETIKYKMQELNEHQTQIVQKPSFIIEQDEGNNKCKLCIIF